MDNKRYLGDLVYVEHCKGDLIRLFIEDDDGKRHIIYLNGEVYANLIQFVEDLNKTKTEE